MARLETAREPAICGTWRCPPDPAVEDGLGSTARRAIGGAYPPLGQDRVGQATLVPGLSERQQRPGTTHDLVDRALHKPVS
jgi:hypothetical protein